MRKKILAFALTMLLTLLPVSALAAEGPEETDPPAVTETGAGEEIVEAELDPNEELYTSDELFMLYVDDVFELDQFPNLFATGTEQAYEQLTENQQAAYTEILGKVDELLDSNNATATSTGFTVTTSLTSNDEMKVVYQALKTDNPQKFFWAGLNYSYGMNTLSIAVSKDYSSTGTYLENGYTVDKSKVAAVDAALKNAATIVTEAAKKATSYEKLKYINDEICRRVEYNDAATKWANTDYGNPWQLIWVFDNLENTNVVCEGYAKAFQYLCDQVFKNDSSVQCYTVTGYMDSEGGMATGAGGHMWNVVTLEGKNYIVDVTNCDGNSIGAPYGLFLAGNTGEDVTYKFQFEVEENGEKKTIEKAPNATVAISDTVKVHYLLDDDLFDHIKQKALNLAATNYKEADGPAKIVISVNADGTTAKTDTGSFTSGGSSEPTEITYYLVPTVSAAGGTAESKVVLKAEVQTANGAAVQDRIVTWNLPKYNDPQTDINNYISLVDNKNNTATVTIKNEFYKNHTISTVSLATITVAAAYGSSVKAEYDLNIGRKAAEATFLGEISGPDSIQAGKTGTFTTTVYDQYGEEMPTAVRTWDVKAEDGTNVPAGVTNAGSVVTVASTVIENTKFKVVATVNGMTAEKTVTVSEAPALNVTVTPASPSMVIGTTQQLTPSCTSNDAAVTGVTYTYASSDDAVTVSNTGLVTAAKVGSATITVTATKDGYKDGTASVKVTVTAKGLAGCTVSDIPAVTYDGAVKTPEVTVKDGDKDLVKGTDYTVAVAPENPTNAGTYTVTIAGQGNYSGSVKKNFVINKAAVTKIKEAAPTRTINASDAANTGAAALKMKMALPAQVTAVFGDNKEQSVNITWGDATPAFAQKGAVYTYVGTLATDANLDTTGKTLTATLTVTVVNATVTAPGTVSHSASEVSANKDNLKGLANLPKTLTVTYTPTDDVTAANTSVNITGWTEKTAGSVQSALAALAADRTLASKNVVLVPTYALPAWATKQGADPELTLTITNKKTATVTITGLTGKTYDGKAIAEPTVTPTADGGTLGANPETTIVYKDSKGTTLASDQRPTNAGTYTVTVTYEDDEYLGTKSETVTIEQREAALAWTGADARSYNGTASDVTATVSNLVPGDTCIVTVEGGKETNAGTYTATAKALSNANYKLPAAATQSYTIAKATRTLTVTPETLVLTPKTAEGTITATVDENGDKDSSFAGALKFALSGDTTAVTWNKTSKKVTGTGNGVVTIAVSVDATDNYEAVTAETVTVTAVMQPVLGITSVTGDTGDQLSASLDGKTIKVTGIGKKDQVKIALKLAAVTGVTLSQDPADDAPAGSKIDVKLGDGTVIDSYTVDTTGVREADPNVTITTGTNPAPTVDDSLNGNADASAAATNLNPAIDGLNGTAIDELLKAGQDATEGEKTVTVTTTVVVKLIGFEKTPASGSEKAIKLDVAPQYTVTVEGEAAKDPVKITSLPSAVKISVTIPAGFFSNTDNVYVRHHLSGGGTEILKPTWSGNVISWFQKSFSLDDIYETTEKATITFTFADGTTRTIEYTPDKIGEALPDSGNSNGWKYDGQNYTKMTQELLTKISGKGGTASFAVADKTPDTPVTPSTPSRPSGGSSGSSGSSHYTVSSKSNMKNGSLSYSTTSAKEGEKVTITPKPNKGYEVASITVLDKNGDKVRVLEENGKFTFTMPKGKVTVEATFRRIEDAGSSSPFVDVPANAYYADAVAWAVANKITNGTGADTFSPNAPCTRGQMVTFLWKAAGSPAPSSRSSAFTDVDANAYYADAVLWAVEQGITKGTTATTFSPNATVDRGQTVTFLYRYAGAPGASGTSPFTDVDANAYYADAVQWAVDRGITQGTGADTFSPAQNCTRAQIVTFLYRHMV